MSIWGWLRDEHNRGALNLICIAIAMIVSAGWAIFQYMKPSITSEAYSDINDQQKTLEARNIEGSFNHNIQLSLKETMVLNELGGLVLEHLGSRSEQTTWLKIENADKVRAERQSDKEKNWYVVGSDTTIKVDLKNGKNCSISNARYKDNRTEIILAVDCK